MVLEGEAQRINIFGQFSGIYHFATVLVHLIEETGQRIREAVRMTDIIERVHCVGLIGLTTMLGIEIRMDYRILIGGNHIHSGEFDLVFHRKAEHSGDSRHLHALSLCKDMHAIRQHIGCQTCSVSPFPCNKLKGIDAGFMQIRNKLDSILIKVFQAHRSVHAGLRTVTRNAASSLAIMRQHIFPFQAQCSIRSEVTLDGISPAAVKRLADHSVIHRDVWINCVNITVTGHECDIEHGIHMGHIRVNLVHLLLDIRCVEGHTVHIACTDDHGGIHQFNMNLTIMNGIKFHIQMVVADVSKEHFWLNVVRRPIIQRKR